MQASKLPGIRRKATTNTNQRTRDHEKLANEDTRTKRRTDLPVVLQDEREQPRQQNWREPLANDQTTPTTPRTTNHHQEAGERTRRGGRFPHDPTHQTRRTKRPTANGRGRRNKRPLEILSLAQTRRRIGFAVETSKPTQRLNGEAHRSDALKEWRRHQSQTVRPHARRGHAPRKGWPRHARAPRVRTHWRRMPKG